MSERSKIYETAPVVVLFSLFNNDFPVSLPSSVSCSLYADDLAIWSSSPSVPTAVEISQGALFRLKHWSEYWCLPLNPSQCEASFFSVELHQANLQFNLFLRFSPRNLCSLVMLAAFSIVYAATDTSFF